MRPITTCSCKHVNAVETDARFVILMHPKEYRKERNGTGHMTNLQLKNSEIIVGVDFTKNQRVKEILEDEERCSFLLYPGKDSFNLSRRGSVETHSLLGGQPYIFILDGTWPCARKMLRLSSNLQQLQRISFDNTVISKFVFKQQPKALCLSTIESVHTVINLLKERGLETCNTQGFLSPFEKMIEQQIEFMQNANNIAEITTPKINYKERNILFEND